MAVQQMSPGVEKETGRMVHRETVAAGATTDWVLIPSVDRFGVGVSPGGGGNAKVQFSISDAATLASGTPVVIDWGSGTVTALTHVLQEAPVTAVRATAGTAAAEFWVVV